MLKSQAESPGQKGNYYGYKKRKETGWYDRNYRGRFSWGINAP